MPSRRYLTPQLTDYTRPLLYRPTAKLKKKDSPHSGYGWKVQAFTDERGNIYERERDGEWERWTLITSRVTRRGKVLYRADVKKTEPEEHLDCRDRIDDLEFAALAVCGLIDDARERGLFSEQQLESMSQIARYLYERAASLESAIAEVPRNGHAQRRHTGLNHGTQHCRRSVRPGRRVSANISCDRCSSAAIMDRALSSSGCQVRPDQCGFLDRRQPPELLEGAV